MTLRQAFTDFIFATNTDGSGKATSCVRALDMPGLRIGSSVQMFAHGKGLTDLANQWKDGAE